MGALRAASVASLALALLSACASPRIDVNSVDDPASDPAPDKAAIAFQLNETVLIFRPIRRDQALAPGQILQVRAVPLPQGPTWYVRGKPALKNWGVATAIAAVHRDDTDVLGSLLVETTDYRVKAANAVISAVSSLSPLFSTSKTTASFMQQDSSPRPAPQAAPVVGPSAVLVADLLKSDRCSGGGSDGRGALGCRFRIAGLGARTLEASADLSALPLDAAPSASLASPAGASGKPGWRTLDHIFFSACRSMILRLTDPGQPGGVWAVAATVADPRFVQTAGLPRHGEVRLGAACGADVRPSWAPLPAGPAAPDAEDAQAATAVAAVLRAAQSFGGAP